MNKPGTPGAAEPNPPEAVSAPEYRGGRTIFQESLAGRSHEVRLSLARIIGTLAKHGLSAEDCMRAEVVLAEIMNNIVEHAYFCRQPGDLLVRIDRLGDILRIRVEDDGAPMPGRMLPTGHLQDLSVALQDLPEGGFGWLLIRELTKDLEYIRHDGRNRLTFSLPTSG